MNRPPLVIESWTPEHPRWEKLVELIRREGQTDWALDPYFARFSRHFLVAQRADKLVGFLMFVHWEIGPHDRKAPKLQLSGETLTEAKVLAFGVPQPFRRQGIGRTLQERTIERARELGCYQVRSVSELDHGDNHQLKLSLGFAVEPMERPTPTFAFIMPLRHR